MRPMGAATFPETLGRFGVGASSELILFMFLMSMIGGIGLIEARRLGVIRRDPVDTDPGPSAGQYHWAGRGPVTI